jgi:hypothetical protein
MLKQPTLTLKREGIPSATKESTIEIRIMLAGKSMNFIYEIPDAPGAIMATNQNEEWIEDRLQPLLRHLFGKIV